MCVGYKWESLVAIYWKQLSPENCLFDNVHLSLGRVTLWKWRKCKEPLTFLCPFLGANVVRVSLLLWCGDLKALISWCLGQNHSLSPRAALGCMRVRVCLWVKHWHGISDRTYLTASAFDGPRREGSIWFRSFSECYSHTHTHVPASRIKARGQVWSILRRCYHHRRHIVYWSPPDHWSVCSRFSDIPIRSVGAVVSCALCNSLYHQLLRIDRPSWLWELPVLDFVQTLDIEQCDQCFPSYDDEGIWIAVEYKINISIRV